MCYSRQTSEWIGWWIGGKQLSTAVHGHAQFTKSHKCVVFPKNRRIRKGIQKRSRAKRALSFIERNTRLVTTVNSRRYSVRGQYFPEQSSLYLLLTLYQPVRLVYLGNNNNLTKEPNWLYVRRWTLIFKAYVFLILWNQWMPYLTSNSIRSNGLHRKLIRWKFWKFIHK